MQYVYIMKQDDFPVFNTSPLFAKNALKNNIPEFLKRGQRGPDKKKRSRAARKSEQDKAKRMQISLYSWEKSQLIERFGSLTKAIRSLIKK